MARLSRQEKARLIAKILDKLYPSPQIPLAHRDPFTLLVSTILSAQCTDARVNQVTPTLFALADSAEKMSRLSPKSIERIIRPCGLAPTKARSISSMSRILLKRHAGKVPASLEAMEELPGVGHKTASVVASQAFNIPAFPVDTHIHRLAFRWGLSSAKSVETTERDLKRCFPESDWRKRHLQIILFGREHCPARSHDPKLCPICSKFGRRAMFGKIQAHAPDKGDKN